MSTGGVEENAAIIYDSSFVTLCGPQSVTRTLSQQMYIKLIDYCYNSKKTLTITQTNTITPV